MKRILTAAALALALVGTAGATALARADAPAPAPGIHQVEHRIEAQVDARLRVVLPRLSHQALAQR